MIDTLAAISAGALHEIAGAFTLGTAAQGIVGGGAEAGARQVLGRLAAAVKTLSGKEDGSADTVILATLRAYAASWRYHVETLASQTSAYADLRAVERLRAALRDFDGETLAGGTIVSRQIIDIVGREDISRPTPGAWAGAVAISTRWCEAAIQAPLPAHWPPLFTAESPSGRKPWLQVFRAELARMVEAVPAFGALVQIGGLQGLAEGMDSLHAIAARLQGDVRSMDNALVRVATGVDAIVVHQREQTAQIQRLEMLLASVGGESSPETLRRILAGTIARSVEGARSAGLIVARMFTRETPGELFDRERRRQIYRSILDRLDAVIGPEGHAGRIDGDEFDIVLRDIAGEAEAAAVAQAIVAALAEPIASEGAHIVLSPAIGVAIAPRDGLTADALHRNAGLALAHAWNDEVGAIRFFRAEMRSDNQDRERLERDLRAAIRERAFQLVYQPIVDCRTRRIEAFEALIRWQHPTRGWLSPATFIPIAEDAGIMMEIETLVLEAACRAAREWPSEVNLAVNLSVPGFLNPNLPDWIARIVGDAGFALDRLELEITEAALVRDTANARRAFEDLTAQGVRFTLDDFGTGYSTLGFLQQMPFRRLKMDQSFVRGATSSNARQIALLKAVAGLAESLGMIATAEGIETQEQLDLLAIWGYASAQGYFFTRPLAAEDATKLLRDGLA